MPNRYVLDAHAWVEYLRGSPPGKRVKEVLESGSAYTTSVTLAEVLSHVSKERGDAGLAAQAIQTLSEIIDVDSELSVKAAERQAQGKVTLQQAYLLEAAKKVGAELVTGDKKLASGRAIFIS